MTRDWEEERADSAPKNGDMAHANEIHPLQLACDEKEDFLGQAVLEVGPVPSVVAFEGDEILEALGPFLQLRGLALLGTHDEGESVPDARERGGGGKRIGEMTGGGQEAARPKHFLLVSRPCGLISTRGLISRRPARRDARPRPRAWASPYPSPGRLVPRRRERPPPRSSPRPGTTLWLLHGQGVGRGPG